MLVITLNALHVLVKGQKILDYFFFNRKNRKVENERLKTKAWMNIYHTMLIKTKLVYFHPLSSQVLPHSLFFPPKSTDKKNKYMI